VAQPLERKLRVAKVECYVRAVVLEAPVLGHFHRGAVLRSAADADPGRVLSTVAEGRVTSGADPLAAAIVSLVLLLEAFEELLHQLVGIEVLQRFALLFCQSLEVLGVVQPVEQLVARRELGLDAVKDVREDAVERIEVGLALDQAGLCQVIEAEQVAAMQPLLEGGHQHLPFLDGDGDAFVAQAVEEVEEHRVASLLAWGVRRGPAGGPTGCTSARDRSSCSAACRRHLRSRARRACPARS